MEGNISSDNVNESNSSMLVDKVYKMAWTSYIRPVLIFIFLFFLCIGFYKTSMLFSLITSLINLGLLAYSILYRYTYKLYLDEKGVWVSRGVLPWEKGTYGVKWRDLDEAVYFNNMSSYLFKSYDLTLRHRFTKSSEISLKSIDRGDKAVMDINEYHHYLIDNRMI